MLDRMKWYKQLTLVSLALDLNLLRQILVFLPLDRRADRALVDEIT